NHSYAIVSNGALFRALALCCHTIPAGLADLFRRACGRRPVFGKMVSKTARFLETMSYFGLREWQAANDNVVRLRTLLGHGEAQLLEFDLAAVDWDEYFRTYIPGIRRYVLGEPHDGCRWSGRWNRRYSRMWYTVAHSDILPFAASSSSSAFRIHFWCQLLYKALWIYVCLRFARRVRRTYVVRNLFSILISQGHVA
ncbi:fatty acyl-CoA reductase 1-like, partial [Anopheles cruzii]|uniref:fatty acyl-CoA reductase 1-like n=1 Tax=Anopheles cruzii TaxID=68878 RepID=UPI0022EC5DD9